MWAPMATALVVVPLKAPPTMLDVTFAITSIVLLMGKTKSVTEIHPVMARWLEIASTLHEIGHIGSCS
ncbi:MAG: hypothetical protein OJF49_004839 [Ktedonobacterales bacterium]|jgi:hypothetical protein|nr:MAG: hypothetical protein OJF49_004839 [Ktedonobacterales bacterium]